MALETTRFDIAEHLDSDEAIAIYLSDALETGDAGYVAHALGEVARARGMSQIAKEAGLGRESLYKALSDKGNPAFDTVLRVLKALDIKLVAEPAPHRA